MADLLSVDVDTSRLIAALDRLGDVVHRHVKAAAKVTADRIAAEAKMRVPRATGETAAGIHVEEAHSGDGYVVLPSVREDKLIWHNRGRGHIQNYSWSNLPWWLESGTWKMAPRPFFFPSARLEEGPHDRRVREAIEQAIREAEG